MRAAFLAAIVLAASSTFCAGAAPEKTAIPSAPRVLDAAAPQENLITVATVDVESEVPADPFASPSLPEPRWAQVDATVEAAIADGKMPGCVVVIGTRDEIVYRRAYGSRSIEPARTPMTLDTLFDLASLTKAVATTSSIMVLVDRGQIALDEPAARYVPELARGGKGQITVRQLLLHTAGFAADNALSDFAHGPDEMWRRLFDAPARSAPGARFVYSDVGFMVLGEMVHRVSGKDVAAFAAENVFSPLAMRETTFNPQSPLKERAAPTETRDGAFIKGDVHDPRAYAMSGIAGHAGLFSTARDLSRFAQTWLGKGEARNGPRVVRAETFDAFLAPHDVPGGVRALGWDITSLATKNRGDGLSYHAYGHGGYTGTSLWIDPEAGFFVLFLSNRVHPNGKGAAHETQTRVASLAAAVLAPRGGTSASSSLASSSDAGAAMLSGDTLAGVDVLRRDAFAQLRGRRVALLTNGSARAKDGTRTLDVLAHAPGVTLVRVFTPEHGLSADREGAIADEKDGATELPVVSLYGATLAPPPETLADIDTLVVDLPDVGARFYTYASTMRRAMKAAANARIRFVVLDRPNPIDGVDVAGPLSDADVSTFVHFAPLPVRHGMTMGELAQMFDADEHVGTELRVVRAEGWRRADYLDATGLAWTAPSPNLRNVSEAVLYPGVALVEGTNVSVGRGTDTPFEIVGAPYIDGVALAAALEKHALPGVTFAATSFTPTANPFRSEKCGGVRLTVTDRARFEPVTTGIALALSLHTLYPTAWHFADTNRLLANRAAMEAIGAQKSLPEIAATWAKDLAAFKAKRDKYLIYRVPAAR